MILVNFTDGIVLRKLAFKVMFYIITVYQTNDYI
jgi:hypothetical protein